MAEKLIHNFDTMRELIEKLNYHTALYDSGKEVISDKEWDDMYFQLQELEKEFGVVLANSPTNHIDYQIVNSLKKVTHNHPMLSLDKTKNIEDIKKFLGNKEGIAMAKMDGLTCSLKYLDGKLVSAETRGNGEVGEDVIHNIVFVKGVPTKIPIKEEVIIDGEVICTYEDFEAFKDVYKNPRNFASGSIRLLDARASAMRNLTFVAWDCIKGIDESLLTTKLIKLNELGFLFVPHVIVNGEQQIEHSVYLIKEMVKEFSYPIDGLVFKYNDCAYYQSLGYTGHHFRGGIAYKFYDDEYDSKLRNIEWSMGKTGQITPVAIFDEIDDGESIVTRASLHNLNIMNQVLGHPYVGEDIKVIKANQIIPQIVWGDKQDADLLWYLNPPKICPCCGAETYIRDDFLYCSNSECSGKLINRLDHFCSKKGLDIKGLSKATLEKLINWEWVNSISDIFKLYQYKNEWYKKNGFGVKSVDNILFAIENAKECELWQFISAISIPLIGSTYAKEICKHEIDWHNIREDIEGEFNFMKWDGFGSEMDAALHGFNYEEADYLVQNFMNLKNSLYGEQTIESPLKGKIIVITGSLKEFKNRDELKSLIEKYGGKVTDSISKKTNYLINNDINSTSSKNVKAQALNIPIITENDFLKIIDL